MTPEERAYIGRLFPPLEEIGSADLREKVAAVWVRLWKESGYPRIEDAPWWVPRRHETKVTNVRHVNEVALCAMKLADVAEFAGVPVDRDLLLAGALLQDADKLTLFHPESFEETVIARSAQHTFYGAHVALEAGLPWEVVHLILSHSKNTNVRPRTTEAVLLHYADYVVCDIRGRKEGWDDLYAEIKPKWSRR